MPITIFRRIPCFSTIYYLHHRFNTTTHSYHKPPLLQVCKILYQLCHSNESELFASLSKCDFPFTHELFLQVCNKFPCSWRAVYFFYKFTQTQPQPTFNPTSISLNKMLQVAGNSHNNHMLWDLVKEIGRLRLVTDETFVIAIKALASGRQLKKCVEIFHIMNEFEYGYNLGTLNKVVDDLCRSKLALEAKHIVGKLIRYVKPDGFTYKCLICGFCDVGDLIEASKMWNCMVDGGFKVDVDAAEAMINTLYKTNRFDEAMNFFESVKVNEIDKVGLSTYRLVIRWLCKRESLGTARQVFDEMLKRGIEPDSKTLAWLIYGFLTQARVREAYKIAEGIDKPDITVYHCLIKGLLKLNLANEATNVFREMIRRGCEPRLQTYIMLLQGHLGKRGKRGRRGEDPLINFETIFVGGLIKAGKWRAAMQYVERSLNQDRKVPNFDYNRFLCYYSNEEGIVMFDVMSKKLKEVGLFDLGDIFERYGHRMAAIY